MKSTIIVSLLLSLLISADFLAQATHFSNKSHIVYPYYESTISSINPTLIGFARDLKNKPLENHKVVISIDGKKYAFVTTNKNGVWSYKVRLSLLTDGKHFIHASSLDSDLYFNETFFTVKSKKTDQLRTCNVSLINSAVTFPNNQGAINEATPTVLGLLENSSGQSVSGAPVIVYVDNVQVGTTTSDSNGVWSYTLTSDQSLSQGSHSVYATACQSPDQVITLPTNAFIVDTAQPSTPTIQNASTSDSVSTVSGTSDPDNMITVYFSTNQNANTDNYGEITYADDSGNWSLEVNLSAGIYWLFVQAQDDAFNLSNLSNPSVQLIA